MNYILDEDSVDFQIEPSEFKNILNVVIMKLLDYIYEKSNSIENIAENTLLFNLFNKFHQITKRLEHRHAGIPILVIENGYNLKDLLNTLLYKHFDSIQVEEYGHIYAGKRSRIDFF